MSFRDNNILGLERMFMLLSFAQAIAAITFAIIGGEVFKEKFLHEMGSFKRIHSEIQIFIALMSVIGVIAALTGIVIGRSRKSLNAFVAIHGFLLLVTCVLPYNIQGAEFLNFARLPLSDFQDHCEMTDMEKYRITDPMERFVALTATKFDYMTEALIDRVMCSDKCPCYVG